jgi:hypothetical protein
VEDVVHLDLLCELWAQTLELLSLTSLCAIHIHYAARVGSRVDLLVEQIVT